MTGDMKETVERLITAETEETVENGYIDEKTGLLMCGICNTPCQTKVVIFGEERVVGCMCRCRADEAEREKKRQADEENLRRIGMMRSAGLQDRAFYNYTFEKCDDSQKNKGYAIRYVENFAKMQDSGQGLLFWGNVGTGKTFLAGCIANALLERRIPVLMTSFPKILNALGGLYSDEKNGYLRGLNEYRLLVIDDFGVERGSGYTLETVYTVVDERYKSGLPFLVTTNIELGTLRNPKDIEHARIYDRILERCLPVRFTGKNYRQEMEQENRERMIGMLKGDADE